MPALPVDQGVLDVHCDAVRPGLQDEVPHAGLNCLVKSQHHSQQIPHLRPVPRHALLRRQDRRRHILHPSAGQRRPGVEGIRRVVAALAVGVGVEDDTTVGGAEEAGPADPDGGGGPGEGGEPLVEEDAAGGDAVLGDAEDLQVLGLGVGTLRVPGRNLHPLFSRPLPETDHIQAHVRLIHPVLQRQIVGPLHRIRQHLRPPGGGNLGVVLVHAAAEVVADDLDLPVRGVGVGGEGRPANGEGDCGLGVELAQDCGGVGGVGGGDDPLECRGIQSNGATQLHPAARLEAVPAVTVAHLVALVLRCSGEAEAFEAHHLCGGSGGLRGADGVDSLLADSVGVALVHVLNLAHRLRARQSRHCHRHRGGARLPGSHQLRTLTVGGIHRLGGVER
mmetsp:Transcript_29811/g.76548  ORF Transcript_29811/g.76548 Transcript_29811/m.76548 type:complete len:391 (-) Transcript_29811:1145-2317(-)